MTNLSFNCNNTALKEVTCGTAHWYQCRGGSKSRYNPRLIGGGANETSGSGMEGGQTRATSRLIVKKAMGNLYVSGLKASSQSISAFGRGRGLGPFRASTNAGDVYNTVNSATRPELGRPPNQVNNIKPVQLRGLKHKAGGIRNDGKSAYSGNPRYVYDSSDYSRYRRLRQSQLSFNDCSFGGDQSNASQTALSRVIH
jgi:hypothetical protein